MERMFCALNGKSSTRFVCVRYGNVAWSTGSVLPIWKKMHEETGVIGSYRAGYAPVLLHRRRGGAIGAAPR